MLRTAVGGSGRVGGPMRRSSRIGWPLGGSGRGEDEAFGSMSSVALAHAAKIRPMSSILSPDLRSSSRSKRGYSRASHASMVAMNASFWSSSRLFHPWLAAVMPAMSMLVGSWLESSRRGRSISTSPYLMCTGRGSVSALLVVGVRSMVSYSWRLMVVSYLMCAPIGGMENPFPPRIGDTAGRDVWCGVTGRWRSPMP